MRALIQLTPGGQCCVEQTMSCDSEKPLMKNFLENKLQFLKKTLIEAQEDTQTLFVMTL